MKPIITTTLGLALTSFIWLALPATAQDNAPIPKAIPVQPNSGISISDSASATGADSVSFTGVPLTLTPRQSQELAATNGNSFTAAHPTDAEGLLLQIDLRVTLQHYEKLATELYETELQCELAMAGDAEAPQGSPLADAVKAERKLRENPAATKEELAVALMRVKKLSEARMLELRRKKEVILGRKYEFRERVEKLTEDISKRDARKQPTKATPTQEPPNAGAKLAP